MVLETRAVSHATPIVTSHRTLENDGNSQLKITVVKGPCTRDALPHASNIGGFKTLKGILPQ